MICNKLFIYLRRNKEAVLAGINNFQKGIIMKFIKGCLTALIVFIAIGVIGYFFFKNSVVNDLENLNNTVTENWSKYVEDIKERNAKLAMQIIKNDSIKYYLEKGKSIPISQCSKELEFNEYKTNQFLMVDSFASDLNDKMNFDLDRYNEAVREYNVYRVRFPNSVIARRTKFPKDFNFFDIRYGVDNEKAMVRKKKVEYWIENGGDFPE